MPNDQMICVGVCLLQDFITAFLTRFIENIKHENTCHYVFCIITLHLYGYIIKHLQIFKIKHMSCQTLKAEIYIKLTA